MLKIEKNKRALLKNTVMLYILNFSTYLISFATVPYQTRVLGVEMCGLVSVANALMVYFQLVIDFGFLLSATHEVSLNRENTKKLSEIFSSVTYGKFGLILISAVTLFALCYVVPSWQKNKELFYLFFLSTAVGSLLPDYLYRGIERMGVITVRTVSIKIFFALLIFVFVKAPEDYIFIPVINLFGNIIALVGVYIHMRCKLAVGFVNCSSKQVLSRFKTSSMFFISRIATTVYTAANTIILDLISGAGSTAFYSSADKLVSTAKKTMSPLSDSLYPYMVKNKDFKLVKKVLLLIEPIVILGCIIVFIWAKPLCIWFFGKEFAPTAAALRALLPTVTIILPSYIFGFPVLSAMGLSKYANYSVIVASVIHIINLIILYVTNNMTIITLGIATSIAEALILIYRLCVVYKNRHLMRGNNE